MPRWEVCTVDIVTVQGGRWGRKIIEVRAHQFTAVPGELPIIAAVRGESSKEQELVQALVAQLGADGWEPMPLMHVRYDSSSIRWYFKRQLPDDAL